MPETGYFKFSAGHISPDFLKTVAELLLGLATYRIQQFTNAHSPSTPSVVMTEHNRNIFLTAESTAVLDGTRFCGTSKAHCHHTCTIFRTYYFRHKAGMPQIEDPRHNLRLPSELKKKLLHSAVDNGRSMNAEILTRLEASFAPEPMREIENLLRCMAALSNDERAQVSELLSKATSILSKR